jgi:hypothetical protein
MKTLMTQFRFAAVMTALVFAGAVIVVAADEAAAPESPFNGKDLTGWKQADPKAHSEWVVGTAKIDPDKATELIVTKEGNELINAKAHSIDIATEAEYGDCHLELEVMVPKGSNSGIYLQGRYEVQVLDSFGKDKDAGKGDMGAVYNQCAPKDPKYKAPGEWQKFVIDFQAPKFDADGKRTAKGKFIKIVLNGVTIVENFEVDGTTGGPFPGLKPEAAKGPLMFQGNHGAVSFRNIKITPLK